MAYRITTVALVMALSGAAVAQTAGNTQGTLTSADRMILESCMTMSTQAMTRDSQCAALLQKLNIPEADAGTVQSCRALSFEAMARDADCAAIKARYPGVFDTSHLGRPDATAPAPMPRTGNPPPIRL